LLLVRSRVRSYFIVGDWILTVRGEQPASIYARPVIHERWDNFPNCPTYTIVNRSN
jgi:hypothetical protein